ncbi:hypothetical protein TNCV_3909141 [Trichonephila clavipes]|nr:hypothetical protein TNCV_3909141 [Trichonephila clavipes]
MKLFFFTWCLFRGSIGPNFVFMDDDTQPHYDTHAVPELLESKLVFEWIGERAETPVDTILHCGENSRT